VVAGNASARWEAVADASARHRCALEKKHAHNAINRPHLTNSSQPISRLRRWRQSSIIGNVLPSRSGVRYLLIAEPELKIFCAKGAANANRAGGSIRMAYIPENQSLKVGCCLRRRCNAEVRELDLSPILVPWFMVEAHFVQLVLEGDCEPNQKREKY
jgi:hypothetical protein